jgi:hypothetical protein
VSGEGLAGYSIGGDGDRIACKKLELSNYLINFPYFSRLLELFIVK